MALKSTHTFQVRNPKSTGKLAARTLAITSFASMVLGCGGEPITEASFSHYDGRYPTAIQLHIELPDTAANAYLTTDGNDPIASASCAFAGQDITIDRSTQLKLTYDVSGETLEYDFLYLIEDVNVDNGFTNRNIIYTWERFFLNNVVRQFNPPTDKDSVLTLNDDQDGQVILKTKIPDTTIIGGFPKAASQHYVFENFERKDADTKKTVRVSSGGIYGYRDGDGGYYSTLQQGGDRLKFAGSYNGWADGDFLINQDGLTHWGSYTIYCVDQGCADRPVIYALDSKAQFQEIDTTTHENSWTCK